MSETTAVDALVARYCELADQIATLTAQLDSVKTAMRTLGNGHHATSYGMTVTITPQRRFDATQAQAQLSADLLAQCMDFSAAKARKVLPPATYEALMTEAGDPRVVVK